MTGSIGSDAIILGHSGFLGRALYRQMSDAGDHVKGYSSADVDLRDPHALAALGAMPLHASTVIITAALTPERGTGIVQYADHSAMLVNVARFLGERDVKRVVFVSTDGVCAASEGWISEDCPIAIDSLYTLAKYDGEQLFAHVAKVRGFELLTVRPVALFGPGDPHNSYGPNRFVRSIAERRPIELFGEGEELRDHVFVDDAAVAIRRLAHSSATGVVTLASGSSRSFASIADDLAAMSPIPVQVTHLPRRAPIAHRRFSTARLSALLPDLQLTPFESALRTTLDSALGARSTTA